jgi:dynein heavy chain, axonemal
VNQFHKKVQLIETKVIVFLDTSFQNLRSAESAFQLLQNFKNIQSRETINRKMNEKFADILKQYGNEVKRMMALFRDQKERFRPAKNTPPVAGAIAWAESIFERVKKPVMRFKSMPYLLQTPQGQAACQDYVDLGKEILIYQQELYKGWEEKSVETAETFLKCNLKRE